MSRETILICDQCHCEERIPNGAPLPHGWYWEHEELAFCSRKCSLVWHSVPLRELLCQYLERQNGLR